MNDILALIMRHGYLVVSLVVFAEAIGVPVPGAVALVAGGAAAASGKLSAPAVVIFAVMAMLTADTMLYFLGKHTGWTILKFLCRISIDPENCVLKSAESFYKRGRETLLIAKQADGVLMCARHDYSRSGQVKQAYDRLAASGVKLVGAVLNGAPVRKYSYSYRGYAPT